MGIAPSDDSAVKQAGVFFREKECYEIKINVYLCWIASVGNVVKYIGNYKSSDLPWNM